MVAGQVQQHNISESTGAHRPTGERSQYSNCSGEVETVLQQSGFCWCTNSMAASPGCLKIIPFLHCLYSQHPTILKLLSLG
jgi:hypothetical protein